MVCALPPLDMRYSRVVAQNGVGIDLVAFDAATRVPRVAPVVSALPGLVARYSMAQFNYRNNVVVESIVAGRTVFVCYSGLAFGGRVDDGAEIRSGTPIGTIEETSRAAFLRSQDRTAAVDGYASSYLYVEVWRRLPPRFSRSVSTRGVTYAISAFDVISPVEFWPSIGIDFVGTERNRVMAIRAGGPADPAVCT